MWLPVLHFFLGFYWWIVNHKYLENHTKYRLNVLVVMKLFRKKEEERNNGFDANKSWDKVLIPG